VLITGKAEERCGARRINFRIRKWEGVMIERFCVNLSITVSQANVCECMKCFFLTEEVPFGGGEQEILSNRHKENFRRGVP
jgi:hypothetical protein